MAKNDMKTILVQLDPKKKREKKLIQILDNLKDDGIANKEAVMIALEEKYSNAILAKLEEIKQILLIGGRLQNPIELVPENPVTKELQKIKATNEVPSEDEAEKMGL